MANVVWRSALEEIASVTTFPRNDKPQAKRKIPRKTQFSKNKTHLKLSSKSIGQGRGGLEGTVRPLQLRAGSPPKKKITKEKISPREYSVAF